MDAFNVTVSLIAIIAVGVLHWILKRRRQHGLFRKYGIPGPRPELTWGNYRQLKKDRIEVMERWIEEYGKVFGYFISEVPYMVVTDVELLKQCFVSEAHIFHDRPRFPVVVEPFKSCLVPLEGGEWKTVRSVLNPSFTAAKMKMMMEIMSGCTDGMLEVLEERVSKSDVVDMFKVSQGLTLDVITKCALAWQVDCQKNPSDPLLLFIRRMFDEAENAVIQNAIRFPFLRKIIENVYPYTPYFKYVDNIYQNIRHVVELRRGGQRPRATDMLQMMLDAQAGRETAAETPGKNSHLIEDRHLLANCFVFLAAGFETTATSLGFIIYVLAKYPEEQQRILDELSAAFPEKEQDLTYDGIQQLKRLDMVISECLRIYPPVILFVSRTCKEDVTVMGQFFPAGVNVIAPVWHIHHDPGLWPEPFKFDPERFAEGKRHHDPAAYLTFGLGPRVCIGKRFALLELKLAVCKIVRRFKISQCAETQDPLKFHVPTVVINPECGIKIRLEHRNL